MTPINVAIGAGFAAMFFACSAARAADPELPAMQLVFAMPAEEAVQAAAADDRHVFAISSRVIAKYERATGNRIAMSAGEAKHLNSGFLHEGKLYCAHSNYPQKPEHSEIKVLDPQTMRLTVFKDFGESNGSLTWAARHEGSWWCTFAFYGEENGKTRLVKFDAEWRETQAWTYPAEVVKDLGSYSISGGVWHSGSLLATGHDRRVIYRLQVPKSGSVLELAATVASPFPGQGLAVDPVGNGLVGIDRGRKQVIFAQFPK